jgi:hypothetical protein
MKMEKSFMLLAKLQKNWLQNCGNPIQNMLTGLCLNCMSKGLVEIEYDENLQATMHISPEGQKIAREKGLIEMDLNPDIPND